MDDENDVENKGEAGEATVSNLTVEGQRRAIISVFATQSDARLNTRQIHEAAGIPPGSMSYHLDILESDQGLLEEVDREMDGQGSPAKVFALTDRGQEFIDTAADEVADSFVSPLDIAGLESIEEDVESFRERLSHIEQENENRRQEISGIVRLLVDEFGEERVGKAFDEVGQ